MVSSRLTTFVLSLEVSYYSRFSLTAPSLIFLSLLTQLKSSLQAANRFLFIQSKVRLRRLSLPLSLPPHLLNSFLVYSMFNSKKIFVLVRSDTFDGQELAFASSFFLCLQKYNPASLLVLTGACYDEWELLPETE